MPNLYLPMIYKPYVACLTFKSAFASTCPSFIAPSWELGKAGISQFAFLGYYQVT